MITNYNILYKYDYNISLRFLLQIHFFMIIKINSINICNFAKVQIIYYTSFFINTIFWVAKKDLKALVNSFLGV